MTRKLDNSIVLPTELLIKIFDDLPLIKVLKFRINKKLTEVVDQYLKDELQIIDIACGQYHSLILLKKGRVLAMGSNQYGQLGLIDAGNHFTPTEIEQIEPIEQLSAGFNHSIMLSKEKNLWVMGHSKDKQLAFADEKSEIIRLQKISKLAGTKAILAVDFTTAYIDSAEVINSCGNDGLKPHLLEGQLKLLPDWIKIPKHFKVADISAGKDHALLLTSKGEVYGIGQDDQGFLGIGNEDYYEDWVKLPLPTAIKIKATTLGSLILTENYELMASGLNPQLQFGHSDDLTSFTIIAQDVTNFDASNSHTLYVNANNQLYALGSNNEGQLGLGQGSTINSAPNGLFLAKQQACKQETTQVQTPNANFATFFKSKPLTDDFEDFPEQNDSESNEDFSWN